MARIEMPLVGGSVDQRAFIAQQHPRLDIILAHDLTPEQIEALGEPDDDLKYFYVSLPPTIKSRYKAAKINSLHEQLEAALAANRGTCPSKPELYGLRNNDAFTLFQIARVDAVLASDQARSIGDYHWIFDAGLDGGLPASSVVPCLHLFDSIRFDKTLSTLGITRVGVASEISHTFKGGRSGEKMIELLRDGIDNTRGPKTQYRISRRMAKLFIDAMIKAAGMSVVVLLEDVFPSDPAVSEFGYRRRTRPLPPNDGNYL